LRSSYDAIVVGAGHNGLCLAAYLQHAGLSTLVVESEERAGGRAVTEEPLFPGFRHNVHANYLLYYGVMPMVAGFDLHGDGLRVIAPEAQHGLAFSDGRPPIVLHRPDLLSRTHASIARYSRSDADLYVEIKSRAMSLGDVIAAGMYAPPTRGWFETYAAAVEETYADLGITNRLHRKTAKVLIEELFVTPELRASLLQVAAEFGTSIDEAGSAFAFLGFVMWSVANWKLPVGGMGSLAHAFARACLCCGVDVLLGGAVERIVVEGHRATGVSVRNRGELRARQLVASSIDLTHTLLELVGREHLNAATVRQIQAFSATQSPSLASLMFCLREEPSYKSARWDPEIDRCFHTVVGLNSHDEVIEHVRDVERGLLPKPAAAVRVNSLWDSSQAPRGLHTAGGDNFFPSVNSLDEHQWADVKGTYNEAFLRRWAEFAPNMTRENVLADAFYIPVHSDRKLLLREGAAQYRTEVDGLYVCGTSTYPGGGIHGACGFNAYQVIAVDLNLPTNGCGASSFRPIT
jgi:phytoene dehydrogenase-like protein